MHLKIFCIYVFLHKCFNIIYFYISGGARNLASAPLVPAATAFVPPPTALQGIARNTTAPSRAAFVPSPAVIQQIARNPGQFNIQQQPGTARQVLQTFTGVGRQPTLQQQHVQARQTVPATALPTAVPHQCSEHSSSETTGLDIFFFIYMYIIIYPRYTIKNIFLYRCRHSMFLHCSNKTDGLLLIPQTDPR